MNHEVKDIIESGVLTAYLLGEMNRVECDKIALLIHKYPKLAKEYETLQDSLVLMTNQTAVKPPSFVKDKIIQDLNATPENFLPEAQTGFKYYFIALVTSVSLIGLLYFFNKAQSNSDFETAPESHHQQTTKTDDTKYLQANNASILDLPETRRLELIGNKVLPKFKLIAYWNEQNQSAAVELSMLPKLPANECYQMWADVKGEMINIGIINDQVVLQEIKFIGNATSLNITIEPDGGSDHPNTDRLISNVYI